MKSSQLLLLATHPVLGLEAFCTPLVLNHHLQFFAKNSLSYRDLNHCKGGYNYMFIAFQSITLFRGLKANKSQVYLPCLQRIGTFSENSEMPNGVVKE